MLEASGLSDAGCVRPNNEDFFIIDRDAQIFILADGMGGANAGEYASRLGAQKLHDFLVETPERDGCETLREGFQEANRAVREESRTNPGREGMGTTLLAARDIGNARLQIGSVGDSRAYLSRNGELSLITHDQTWVVEVGPQLGLTEEMLRRHPMRHVLTMAVGAAEELRVDCGVLEVQAGDQLLLCSDGLHGVLDEKLLRNALDSEKSLGEKCHYLVEAAKQEGGPDNVTVVLIRVV